MGHIKIDWDEYFNERRKVRAYIDDLERRLFQAQFLAFGLGVILLGTIIAVAVHG